MDKDNSFLVEQLIWKQVEKPKKFCGIRVVNLYDNRYRVNIYEEYTKEGLYYPCKRMFSSFFCILKDGELIITYPDLSKGPRESLLTPEYK